MEAMSGTSFREPVSDSAAMMVAAIALEHVRPGVRIGLGLRRGSLRRLLTLRRRNAGIVGRLRRQAQLGLEFGDPSRQRRHLTHQRGDQRVLLRVREA